MSTSFQNLPSLLNKPGTQSSNTTSGVGAGTLADVLGKGQGGDSQTFAKLMTQYQSPQASAQAQLPAAAVSQKAMAANQALRAKASAQQATANLQPKPQAPKPAQSDAQAQQTQQANKQAQKTNAQAKSNNEARAKARQADGSDKAATARSDAAGRADARDGADQRADEVKFTTAQGEGAAHVQELQPPPDVPTSDPAAMMAWLSSLSQGGEGGQAVAGDADGLEADGTAGGAAKSMSDLLGGGAGKGGPAALPTGTAALTTQLMGQQAAKVDPKGLAQESQGALAAIATQDKSSPLDFNALMARELGRPAGASGPAAEAATHATATLATPVDSADFKQALVERVGMWVSGTPANGQMTAELRLNPEDMGPVHIRIVMDGQNAQVDFAAAHAETRQALEASLPALSSALEDAGLSLAGGGVSDQSASQAWAQQQGQGQGDGQPRAMAWNGRGLGGDQAEADPQAGMAPTPRPSARPGGLDLYA